MTTSAHRSSPRAIALTTGPRWFRAPLAALLALLLVIAGVPLDAQAQEEAVAFTDGGVAVDGVRYAKQGDTVELTVVAPSDTKCVQVSGTHDAERSGGQLDPTQVFDFQVGEGDGPAEVAVRIYTNAGCNQNGETFGSASYVRDNTSPVVTGTLQADNEGDNGWYTGDVTVAWTCSDAGSGLGDGACPDDSIVEGEGDDLSVQSPVVEDRVGNGGTGSVSGIRIDRTAPSTTSDAPNGWRSDVVEVTLTATDNLSQVAATSYRLIEDGSVAGGWQPYGGAILVEDEGWYTLEYRSVDRAGNVEPVRSVEFGIDKTSPTITTSQTPEANDAGWNNDDVTVTFTCDDEVSGIATCTAPVTITEEVEQHPVTGTAKDNAGNEKSATRKISIDKTDPTLSANVPAPTGADGWYTSPVTVTYSCDDPASNDVRSGISTCPGAETLDEDGAGQSTTPVRATDAAGNVSDPVTVTGIDIDQTAPTTTISGVPEGWVNEDVTLTLDVVDAGPSGLAATYYQINGGDEQTYDDGIPLSTDGTHLVTVWSVDVAGNVEVAHNVTVRIDRIHPVSTVSLSETEWTNQPVTVTLSADDEDGGSGVDAIYYQLDGGAVETYDEPFQVGAHGEQALSYWAVDHAGNAEDANGATIRIDTVAPTLTGEALTDTLGDGGWYTGDITVVWTCSDADSGIDGACPSDTILPDEGRNLKAFAHVFDNAGNRTDAEVTGLNLDRTPPRTTATIAPGSNQHGWHKDDVTVTLTAIDELSGVAFTRYRIDEGEWTTVPDDGPVEVPFTDDGEYRLEFQSRDVAGNREELSHVDVRVDQAAPTITSSQSPEANARGWNTDHVTVSFTCEDDLSGIDSCTTPVTVDEEVDRREVVGTAVDRAGNHASTLHLVSIDWTAPVIASQVVAGNAGDNGWYTGPVTIGFDCTDPVSNEVSSGIPSGTCPADQTLSADGAGQSTNAVTVEDRAGNVSDPYVRSGIDIDQLDPTTTADVAPSGWTNQDVTVTLSATDDGGSGVASTHYRVDGGDWKTYASPILFTEQGSATLSFRSTDVAGNVESTQSVQIRIDRTAPQTTATGLPTTDWTNGSVTVALEATDSGGSGVAATYFQIDGGEEELYAAEIPFDDEGVYELRYWSVDHAGNVEVANSATIRIDTTTPTTTSDAPSGWQTESVSVTLTVGDGEGSGVADTFYRIDDGSAQTYSDPIGFNTEGVFVLRYWSVDNAGNVEAESVETVKLDLSDPILTIDSPTDGSSTDQATVTVSGTATDTASGVTGVTVNDAAASFAPGSGAFSLDVDLDCWGNTIEVVASDAAGRSTTVTVSVTRRCAAVTGVDHPLRASSNGDVNINDLRGNRVVPVKVELEYLDEAYTGSNATLGAPTISLRALPDCDDREGTEAVDVDSAGNANTDDAFRWSGGGWIYNLSSRDLVADTCYRIDVRIDGDRASHGQWIVVRAR